MSGSRPLLCGIDAGTSQVRALVFELDGTLVAGAAQPTPTRVLGPDQAELDAEGLWDSIVTVLRRVVAELPDPKAIRGIAVASVGEAGVLLGGTTGHWRRSSPGTTRVPRASWSGSWVRSASSACTGSPACAPTRPSACSSCSGTAASGPS